MLVEWDVPIAMDDGVVLRANPCTGGHANCPDACEANTSGPRVPGCTTGSTRNRLMKTLIIDSALAAVEGVEDGSTVLVGGFGAAGEPSSLIDALIEQGATDLMVVSNNAGGGDTGVAALLAAGRVRKVMCSFPRQPDSWMFDGLYRSGKVELELVPQGTLRAHRADRQGNLVYRKTARNFGPVMATAATTTIAEVGGVVEVGQLDPENVITPSIYVDRILNLASAS